MGFFKKTIKNDIIFKVNNDLYTNDWMTKKRLTTKNLGSSFWTNDFDTSYYDYTKNDTQSLIKLAKYRRVLENFVKIMTGRDDIVVRYAEDGQSSTTGKIVFISSDISDGNFDATVGLALHEASHIVKSDMSLFKNLQVVISRSTTLCDKIMKKYNETDRDKVERFVYSKIKDLTNLIEDRRVDDFVYRTSPGYMIYYHALYGRYFNNDISTKVLLSKSLREENWNSYIYRTIHIMNPATKKTLDSLKNLKKIYDLIDLTNINRLKDTTESFHLAIDIFNIIENSVNPIKNLLKNQMKSKSGKQQKESEQGEQQGQSGDSSSEGQQEQNEQGQGQGQGSSNEKEKQEKQPQSSKDGKQQEKGEQGQSGDSSSGKEEQEKQEGEQGQDDGSSSGKEEQKNKDSQKQRCDDGDDGNYDSEKYGEHLSKYLSTEINLGDLSPEMRKYLDEINKALKTLGEFLDGEVQKASIKDNTRKSIDIIEQANVTISDVGSSGNGRKKCVLIKKMTSDLIHNGRFNNIFNMSSYNTEENQDSINEGIVMGTILGKQLKVRNEKQTLKYSRLEHGKIDTHLISELGYKDNNIFYKTITDKYNDVFMHISVDASGSMDGQKWHKTMKTVVAIAKATSMITGINLVISYRNSFDGDSGATQPFILIAYDSRTDNFMKIKTLFKYLYNGGITPEGLTFDTIVKEFPQFSVGMDMYFLNFSDGMPYFPNYSGEAGVKYTRDQIKKMEHLGVEVLSYYVRDSYDNNSSLTDFRKMYGKNAENIDISSIPNVARTMNKKFLAHESR